MYSLDTRGLRKSKGENNPQDKKRWSHVASWFLITIGFRAEVRNSKDVFCPIVHVGEAVDM